MTVEAHKHQLRNSLAFADGALGASREFAREQIRWAQEDNDSEHAAWWATHLEAIEQLIAETQPNLL